MENGHVTEVASLKKGEWSCYRGGQFNGQRMVMLQKWSLHWRENGYVTDVSVLWRENGYFTEVLTLMDICKFIVFYGQSWCFVSGIQYILPLNLLISLFLSMFSSTLQNFCIQGNGRTLCLQQ